MKTPHVSTVAKVLVVGALCAWFNLEARSQNTVSNNFLNVVRVQATDPNAAEPANPGAFTISREGNASNALPVFFTIGGTASNGVDYATISNSIILPAGEHSMQIPIVPIDDPLAEITETVSLRLIYPIPASGALPYAIGSPVDAVVKIEDNDATNRPPEVGIINPQNNSAFFTPLNLNICAFAHDGDGYVTSVEFFAGTNSLGLRTNISFTANAGGICITWSNVPPGEYNLTAKATDDDGASRVSAPVHIVVRVPEPTPTYVSIRASDPGASEGPNNSGPGNTNVNKGVFNVSRTPRGTNALTVFYTIGGTASNGVDYVTIPGSVTIPPNAEGVNIEIVPIDDNLIEGLENVVLTLVEPTCIAIFPPPPDCYRVSPQSGFAVVNIEDNDRTPPPPLPLVRITTPTNGSMFTAPINIPISATVSNAGTGPVRVEFYAGEHFVGADVGTNEVSYDIIWSNAMPGFYLVRAKVLAGGIVSSSEPVKVTVLGTNLPPPPTNLPSVVTIFASDAMAAEGTNTWRWYTNSFPPVPGAINLFGGTNTAAFTVRRSGAANTSLTVNYAVEGSASNGVDYAALSGVVTIPPGERSARILITPTDDAIPECNETVILRLLPVTNAPPPYVVAWPGRAAAVIVDNDQPPPNTGLLCDRVFHISLPGTGNNHACYRVEISGDMKNWLPVCTNTVTEPVLHFVDPDSRDFAPRFYRAIPVPCPEP